MNVFDPALFAAGAPCIPCCGGEPPAECACALLIPPPIGASPYADYSTASGVLADPLKVASCLAFFDVYSGAAVTASATPGSNSLTLDQTYSGESAVSMWVSLNLVAGQTLSAACTGTYSGGGPGPDDPSSGLAVFGCDGTFLYADSAQGTGTYNYSVTTDGVYIIVVDFAAPVFFTGGWTAANVVLSATTLVPNPVIALWDDSGTTRQLEACPKLYIPTLTESTGSWYADETDAQSAIDTYAVDCLVFVDTPYDVFTVTGGNSLVIHNESSGAMQAWASVNAEVGKTLNLAYTVSPIHVNTDMTIYDYEGNLVEYVADTGSPLVSSGLPYTGRYILKFLSVVGSSPKVTDLTLTSSGTMSTNEIQALYDVSLSCPARLDC